MAMKLYIGGLDYGVTDGELEEFFAAEGKVLSAVVIKDRETGRSKGFGFVEMEDDAEAKAAIEKMNGQDLKGRSIVVNEARPQEDRRPRSDGGGYGGGNGGGGGFRKRY